MLRTSPGVILGITALLIPLSKGQRLIIAQMGQGKQLWISTETTEHCHQVNNDTTWTTYKTLYPTVLLLHVHSGKCVPNHRPERDLIGLFIFSRYGKKAENSYEKWLKGKLF
jgi:hypothetical protein